MIIVFYYKALCSCIQIFLINTRTPSPDEIDRCQALRQAMLRQKDRVEERYGLANPFYWGAFVFLGES